MDQRDLGYIIIMSKKPRELVLGSGRFSVCRAYLIK